MTQREVPVEGLRQARDDLTDANARLEQRVLQLHLAEQLSSVLDSIDNVVWSVSRKEGEVLYLNAAAERMYGRPVSEFFSDHSLWQGIIHPSDRHRVLSCLHALGPDETVTLEYRIVHPDGSVRWLEDRAHAVDGLEGLPARIDGVASDVSARRLQAEHIAYQATHDALTGLPNRNLLRDRTSQALTQARRADQHVALLFIDLDGFKFINDSYGHASGDTLLCTTARRLTQAVREADTVARLGGDEFVILLSALERAEDAVHVAGTVLNAFKPQVPHEGRELRMSASIGISVFPQDGDSFDLLLQHADMAMYRAKASGRNRYQSYSTEMGAQAQDRMELETALHGALEHGQLELYYQPQFNRGQDRVDGVEALLRWHHPTLGMLPPARFIPLAEETGLINSIGEWVLRSACAQAAAWHRRGHKELSVAVNLSASQFHQQDVPALMRSVLASTRLPPHLLELELTESVLMRDTEAMVHNLHQLKLLGVRLALDDFGTGYSSLSYLKRFPIDVIKIDQSFTFEVCTDDGAASITRAIIAMAQSLKLKTVAEGVETPEQLEFLSSLGCDSMQGHYLERPMPVAQMTSFLERMQPQVSFSHPAPVHDGDALPVRSHGQTPAASPR